MYHMVKRHGFTDRNIKVFYANGAPGIPKGKNLYFVTGLYKLILSHLKGSSQHFVKSELDVLRKEALNVFILVISIWIGK